jgi:tetratricopeptide (TPR) repeat protein
MAKQSLKLDTPDTTNRNEGGGFFLGNVRLLGFIGIGLLVVLGGIYFFLSRRAVANERALVELERIRPSYDRSEFTVAINGDTSKTMGGEPIHGLRYIVDEWSSTPAGKIAALFLGNSYLATGQVQKAGEPYETAAGSDAPLVSSAAHAGLAAVAENSKKYEEAAKEYEKAASEDRVELNTPTFLIAAARNYEQAGKKEDAIELYRRVATQYSSSQANGEARLALARFDVRL